MKKFAFYFTLFPLLIFAYSNISTTTDTGYSNKHIIPYGDFLYWKTEEDGLDYIYDDRIDNGNNNGICGDVKRGTYAWQSGFRAGVKYQFSCFDDWLIDGQYGFIGPGNSQTIWNAEHKQMSSTFQMPDNFIIQKAFTKTEISCNMTNLLLQKNICPSPKFRIGFLSGLSGIWMKRDWTLKFYDYSNNIRVIKPSWHFKGVGLKTGFDFDWILKYGFNWSGKSSIAAIYGNFDTWVRAYDLPSDVYCENSHLDDFRIIPNIQCLLGPSWERCFNNVLLKIYLNYEINVWLNLSQTNRSLYQGSTSNPQSNFTKNNLQMYGLTLCASLNF